MRRSSSGNGSRDCSAVCGRHGAGGSEIQSLGATPQLRLGFAADSLSSRATRLRALLGSVLGAVLLAGCAVRPVNLELGHYEPGAGYRWSERRALPDNDPTTLLILAFSGGGTRAAAFSYGVLEELRRTQVGAPDRAHTLLAEVDLISSVSGGSFTSLAYALYGEGLFDHYEQQFLKRDVEGELLRRLFDPFTWPKILSSGFGRSELAEQYYEEILFHGATYADLVGKPTPTAIAEATDIATGCAGLSRRSTSTSFARI